VTHDRRSGCQVHGIQHGVRFDNEHGLEESRCAVGMQTQIGAGELLAAAHDVFLILTNGSALNV
jgi:hypothetical protein